MKRLKSIRGVELYETKAGVRMVYIRFYASGREYKECIGPSERSGARIGPRSCRGLRFLPRGPHLRDRVRAAEASQAGRLGGQIEVVVAVRREGVRDPLFHGDAAAR